MFPSASAPRSLVEDPRDQSDAAARAGLSGLRVLRGGSVGSRGAARLVLGHVHPPLDAFADEDRQDEADDRDRPEQQRQRRGEERGPVAVGDRHGPAQVRLHEIAQKDAQDHGDKRHIQLSQQPAQHPEHHHHDQVESRARDAVNADEGHHRHDRHQELWRDQQHPHEQADHRDVHRQQHEVGNEQGRDQTPDNIRVLLEQQRPRRDVQRQQHRQQHRRRARARHPQRQHRHQRAARGRVVARLGRGDAAGIALAEGAILVRQRLFRRIGHERPQRGPGPRQDARDESQHGRADHRRRAEAQHREGRRDAAHGDLRLLALARAVAAMFEEDEHLGQCKQADDRHEEVDAVVKMHLAE